MMDNKDYLDFKAKHDRAMMAVDQKLKSLNALLKGICVRLGIKYAPRNCNK